MTHSSRDETAKIIIHAVCVVQINSFAVTYVRKEPVICPDTVLASGSFNYTYWTANLDVLHLSACVWTYFIAPLISTDIDQKETSITKIQVTRSANNKNGHIIF